MKQQLKTIDIQGTLFNINVDKEELQEVNNPANVIPFAFMEDKGTHYEFNYDTENRNIPHLFSYKPGMQRVTIEQLCQLDPERMGIKYGLPPESLAGRADISLKVDAHDLQERLSGKTPVIYLAGDPFQVDYAGRKLIGQQGRSVIQLDKLIKDFTGEGFLMYYSSSLGKPADFKAGESPGQGVSALLIPNLIALDPVAASIEHFDSPYQILRVYPPVQVMEAKSISFAEMETRMKMSAFAFGPDGKSNKKENRVQKRRIRH